MDDKVCLIIDEFVDKSNNDLLKGDLIAFCNDIKSIVTLRFVLDKEIVIWRKSLLTTRVYLNDILNNFEPTDEELSRVAATLLKEIPVSVEALKNNKLDDLSASIFKFLNITAELHHKLMDFNRKKIKEEKSS